MRLVACTSCRAQYDTTDIVVPEFPCRCGQSVRNEALPGIDARILRCGACGAGVAEDARHCDYCRSPIRRDRRDLSLICPQCFARNADDTRFCTACGVGFRPQAVPVDGHELPCPACSQSMPPHHVGGIGVNECAACRGLWVPKASFDRLINRAIDAYRSRAAAGYQPVDARVSGGNPMSNKVEYRHCPECRQMMARRNFRGGSGVIVDRCPAHGTWLDANELEEIAGYIAVGGVSAGAQARDTATPEQAWAHGAMPAPAAPLPGAPKVSQRTRQILDERKARRERKPAVDAARSVLGFLGELLTMEIR